MKFVIREICKFTYENLTFFLRQAKAKNLFLLHSIYTGDTPYQVWFNLDNFLIQSKITIIKIRSSRNSQISLWKLNFLARQAIPKTLFVLHSNYTGDTPYWAWLIWTAPWPDEKDLFLKFLKIRNSRNS